MHSTSLHMQRTGHPPGLPSRPSPVGPTTKVRGPSFRSFRASCRRASRPSWMFRYWLMGVSSDVYLQWHGRPQQGRERQTCAVPSRQHAFACSPPDNCLPAVGSSSAHRRLDRQTTTTTITADSPPAAQQDNNCWRLR